MKILITGGAGFIGSHTVVELLNAGYEVVVTDNLCNSSKESIRRVEQITGKQITFYETDIRNREGMEAIFQKEEIYAVIHFAGLKAVGESVHKPLEYYENNIYGTLVLLEVMKKYGVKNMVFSSSATIYGNPAQIPITEECPKGICTNPYGWTKSMLEQILTDVNTADQEWNIILLRYFNPIGAHVSGLIGEDPKGIPNNLLPYIAQVAIGKLKELSVYGNDYPTKDGTGVRDYIHVVDLAKGHVAAINKLKEKPGVCTYNLGTGKGYSVLDVVHAFEQANGVKVPYQIKPRREGDIATCYSDAAKAYKELGWKAQYDIDDMCRDAWNWQSKNPNGYQKEELTLLILAAGMGSRYGGLKQLDPIGPSGEFIIDYSIYDAKYAGFTKVVFVIKEENLELFRETVGKRIEKIMEVEYVFQKTEDIPQDIQITINRSKPWGTAHAVYCARNAVTSSFAVINADDFYGRDAFIKLHDFLTDPQKASYCMVGYPLRNTITENGTVSRGRCAVSDQNYLLDVKEMTKIMRTEDGKLRNIEPGNECELPEDTIVSMNCWGFTTQIFKTMEEKMSLFFENNQEKLDKAEFFLPNLVAESMKEGTCKVEVMTSKDKWFGVTYKEDKEKVVESVGELIKDKVYPQKLF